jgi:hypothetical protein
MSGALSEPEAGRAQFRRIIVDVGIEDLVRDADPGHAELTRPT